MVFRNFLKVSIVAVAFTACSSDDDASVVTLPETGLNIPETFTFTDEDGESTVSFSGQTLRLQQGEEILDLFENFDTTEETLDGMFADGTGFANADLDDSKNIRSKTAASDDYFKENIAGQSLVHIAFDGYISSQVATFLSQYASKDDVPAATAGNAGVIQESANADGTDGSVRLVNENGLEYKQAFNKGLIGAFTLDQIVNNYLSRALVVDNQEANTNNVLDEDNNYTELEHYWDEAYGYAYGNSFDDSFLFKYIGRVAQDADFDTYVEDVETAFITGRAAIVANDYDVVEEQVETLRTLLSEVIAIRAVYYLQQGKMSLASAIENNESNASAFHDLSEGYGFVYSLQFTQNHATNAPYFSAEQVDAFIAQLEEGNGFWDFADDSTVLDTISETIAAEFDFSVEQAATLDLVQ